MATLSELETLNRDFGIEGALRFDQGEGGLVRAQVATTASAGEIYLQGAHVTRWQPSAAQHPVLFVSPRAQFLPGKAIRGGVPIVFPWFADRAHGLPGPMHGFARTASWTIATTERVAEGISITFALDADETSRSYGYDHFTLRYRVVVGATLELQLRVHNAGSNALPVQDALHAYFAVGDIHAVAVSGLSGTDYLDRADDRKRKRQDEAEIHFAAETDQLHLNTQAPVTIHDTAWQRRIVVEKQGSSSTVVWNPWVKKAESLADLGADAWPGMVCVEPANAAEDSIEVAAGADHVLGMTVRLLDQAR